MNEWKQGCFVSQTSQRACTRGTIGCVLGHLGRGYSRPFASAADRPAVQQSAPDGRYRTAFYHQESIQKIIADLQGEADIARNRMSGETPTHIFATKRELMVYEQTMQRLRNLLAFEVHHSQPA